MRSTVHTAYSRFELYRLRCLITARSFANDSLRRKKPLPATQLFLSPLLDDGAWPNEKKGGWKIEPFNPSEDYIKKVSMSPWVPSPDPVARKMLELAKAGPDDIHVDLGSGDGRVNFMAMDAPFEVSRSIGIDVDPEIVQVARDRLSRRFPLPDMDFFIGDLKNVKNPVWDHVKNATIITMYFVEKALEDIRPILERILDGKKVTIVTCGYPITKWDPSHVEHLLGLPVHVYKWGFPKEEVYKPFKGISEEEMEQIMAEHRKNLEQNRKILADEGGPDFRHGIGDDSLMPVDNKPDNGYAMAEIPWATYEEFMEEYTRDDFDSEERRVQAIKDSRLPPEQYMPKGKLEDKE
jgi:hypothetical protein